MRSIRTRISAVTIGAIIITMIIAAVLGVVAIRNTGVSSSEQMMRLLCEAGQKNLDSILVDVEQNVQMISAYVESDLRGTDDAALQAHLDRVSDFFKQMLYKTNGIMTYYYRIDPTVSSDVKGFWFVNTDGEGFVSHEVTDITQYDTEDTSQLVWFTVPKATGKPVWLPPYVTDNLDARVISYNTPVYLDGRLIGVIGIELDYSFMAELVDNITLYENGYAFVNDPEGNLVYHPHMDVAAMETLPEIPEGVVSEDAVAHYRYEGVEKAAVSLPLSNGDRLNVSVPVKEINAGWQRWVNMIVVAFCVLLCAFIAVIARFTGRITKPLRELTKVAEQIGEGNYDHVLKYDGNDEIGVLTDTFSRVTGKVKTYITELNDMTDLLTVQKESLSTLLDHMPAVNFSKDAETGAYLYCNQGFAEYAHKSRPAEVVGLTDADIFDPATARHFAEDDRKALSMDEPYVFFENVADAEGNPRQFRTTKMKFHDSSGRLCLLGMCMDITELERIRKESEETRAAYEETLHASVI
ncbi:MAG: PAS domain-containing protein, partial [Oscillospiraceae bacterium]|nr:PAS domain-containing protein [Oscillospiraceae bacterium]